MDAKGWTTVCTDTLKLASDSLFTTLIISGYSGGSAIFQLLDSNSQILIQDTVSTDASIAHSLLAFPRVRIFRATFANLSGRIAFAIANIPPPSEFPTGIGSTWTYAIVDTVTNARDTVTVTIARAEIWPDGTLSYMWRYTRQSSADSQSVTFERDTARFYDYRYAEYVTRQYVFPLKVDNSWATGWRDTSRVVSQGTVTLPGGLSVTAFRIQRLYQGFNYDLSEDEWFSPGVGMLILSRSEKSFGSRFFGGRWDLLSYSIR